MIRSYVSNGGFSNPSFNPYINYRVYNKDGYADKDKKFKILKAISGSDYDLETIIKHKNFDIANSSRLQEFILLVYEKDLKNKDIFYTRRAIKKENKIYYIRLSERQMERDYIIYTSKYSLYTLLYCELEYNN